jgi:DNA invertase Pin-like site-specific DNA recombinase
MNNLKGHLIGYVRVSTLDQKIQRQEDLLREFNLDEIFIDYASGKDTNRPQLQAALKHLRKGDKLVVHSMDRLARNLDDLRKLVRDLNSRSVAVQFIKESLTFSGDDSPMSNLLLSIMGAFAEFERSLIRERQKEGIDIAKQKGLYKGRKPALSCKEIADLKNRDALNNGRNRTLLANEYSISRQTLYKYLSNYS